jgi:hypothetical protein
MTTIIHAGFVRAGVIVGLIASLGAGVAACSAGGGTAGPAPSSGSQPATTQPSTGAPGASGRGTTGPTSPGHPSTDQIVTLAEGRSTRACGIILSVKFLPPMAAADNPTSGPDQPFLVAGTTSGDQPPMGDTSPARVSAISIVSGKRFLVLSINLTARTVTLQELC